MGGECWLRLLRGKGTQNCRNRRFYGNRGADLAVVLVKWANGDGQGRAYQGCRGDKKRPAFYASPTGMVKLLD